MTPPVPGVMFTPPPAAIQPSLRRGIDDALAQLKQGETGALVLVATTDGVNAAIVARLDHGWAVQAYIGKGWGVPIAGGVTVAKTWGGP